MSIIFLVKTNILKRIITFCLRPAVLNIICLFCLIINLCIKNNETNINPSIPNRWFIDKQIFVYVDRSVLKIDPLARLHIDFTFKEWKKNIPNFPKIIVEVDDIKTSGFDGKNTIAVEDHPYLKNKLAISISYQNDLIIDNEHVFASLQEVDILINKDYKFSIIDENLYSCGIEECSYDFQSLMYHEIGHFFGLEDNNSNCSIMKSKLDSNLIKRKLYEEDIKAIKYNYRKL